MSQPILFVHAAGHPREPDGSGGLIDYLARKLGDGYQVIAPTMPDPENPRYQPWRDSIAQTLKGITGDAILIGHSFGGSVLAKYLEEDSVKEPPRALFLVSAPYWGPGGWEYDEYDLPDSFPDGVPPAPTFLYHSQDDPEVPSTHLDLYAAKLPQAASRRLPGADHSFVDGLPQLVADIRSVAKS